MEIYTLVVFAILLVMIIGISLINNLKTNYEEKELLRKK
jgi:hypothetical protein